jgi:lysophospholipase L1-like esterase
MTDRLPDKQPPTLAELAAEADRTPAKPGAPHPDDSLMVRFDRWNLLGFSAWDSVKAVGLCTLLLLLFAGSSVERAADELDPGIGRDIMLAIAEPAGWVSDQLPLVEVRRDATAWLSPDEELAGGGFEDEAASPDVPPADAGTASGEDATTEPLESLLVTGDSLSTPLDIELARSLADSGAVVTRDPHLGTGISSTVVADWGELSTGQVAQHEPQAVVVFIGANEGYPMESEEGDQVNCCGADWQRVFTDRVSQMMDTYTQDGDSRVYWLTIPTPRDPDRQRIAEVVNDAIAEAAADYEGQVELIDTVEVFTPGGEYRDAMEIDGEEEIVRESDGIHLNEAGSALAAEIVLEAVDADYDR